MTKQELIERLKELRSEAIKDDNIYDKTFYGMTKEKP
jgi:hypothetical protein